MTLPIVCLLTDYGLKDSFVAQIKGVLLSSAPELKIVDITHDIPPQSVRLGAYHLMASSHNFPQGTVFLCVVDPGVGTERKIIYLEAEGRKYIGPDNGTFSWVSAKAPDCIRDLTEVIVPAHLKSQTFHGRDIMAPLVVQLLKGVDPLRWGKPLENLIQFKFPKIEKVGASWKGEILAIDHFGNLITNLKTEEIRDLADCSSLWIEFESTAPAIRGLADSYSDVAEGKMTAIGGSAGFVEISVRNGRADKISNMNVGGKLNFKFRT